MTLLWSTAEAGRLAHTLSELTHPPKKRYAKPTHCVNGHEFTPENTKLGSTRVRGTFYEVRLCRACQIAREAQK